MGALFGKKAKQQQTSKSWNEAYPQISEALSPVMGSAAQGNNLVASLLGIGDPQMGQNAFNAYKQNAGFDFANQRGQGKVVANAAARGLLNSGSTQKGLASFTQGLQSQYYDNMIKNALGFGAQGLNAAQIIGAAGNRSESQGTSTGGKPGLLSMGAMIAASDRRLKHAIRAVAEMLPGLYSYRFRYNDDPYMEHAGFMADEVERVLGPEFLGPETQDGYKTVNYRKVLEAI